MWKTGLIDHPRQGEHGQLRLHGQAELPRLEHQHLLVGHRPPAPLEELQRDRDHDRQHRQVHGRHRPVHLRRRQGHLGHAAVEPPPELVGHEGARDEDADAVPGRHPQHPEHGLAAELPQERHRPQQQLLPRGRQVDRRQGADVLHQGAVHAVRQHRLARAQHDARAARTTRRSGGRSRCRSTSTRSSRPTTATSSPRPTRRACCRHGTSGSTRPSPRSSASSTTSPVPRHCSPPTATRTRTATATSRTSRGSRSTSA